MYTLFSVSKFACTKMLYSTACLPVQSWFHWMFESISGSSKIIWIPRIRCTALKKCFRSVIGSSVVLLTKQRYGTVSSKVADSERGRKIAFRRIRKNIGTSRLSPPWTILPYDIALSFNLKGTKDVAVWCPTKDCCVRASRCLELGHSAGLRLLDHPLFNSRRTDLRPAIISTSSLQACTTGQMVGACGRTRL